MPDTKLKKDSYHVLTDRKINLQNKESYEKSKTQAKQKKMFVCENSGGQKNVHQAGRESIFSLIFGLYMQIISFQMNKKNKRTVKVEHS